MGLIPYRRFALFCHQRSGSNMLTSILNQHPEVVMRGQIFKDDPEYQHELQTTLGMLPLRGQAFDDSMENRRRFDRLEKHPEEREARNFVAAGKSFYEGQARTTLAKTIGIKFHGGTLYEDEIEALFFDTDTEYEFVLLHRENLLEAGISWFQARELNLWVSRGNEKVKPPSLHVDVDLVEEFVTNTHADLEHWKELFSRHGRSYLELSYEQITDPSFDYGILWDHLRVSHIPTPRPKTNKIIKSFDHLENLEEVRERFRGRNFGMI